MEMISNILNNINLDTILSDKMLLIGTIFLILGPLIFLVALLQYVRMSGKKEDFVLPQPSRSEFESPVASRSSGSSSKTDLEEIQEIPAPVPEPKPIRPERAAYSSDQTMIMPPGVP